MVTINHIEDVRANFEPTPAANILLALKQATEKLATCILHHVALYDVLLTLN